MRKRRALLLTAAVLSVAQPSAALAAGAVWESKNAKVTPVVFGDAVELTLSLDQGHVELPARPPRRHAAASVEIDAYPGERLGIGYMADRKLYGSLFIHEPPSEKFPTGWRNLITYPLNDAKPDKVSFVTYGPIYTKKAGRYRIQFWTIEPGVSAKAKVWIFRTEQQFAPNERYDDYTVDRKLLQARAMEALAHPLDPAKASPTRRQRLSPPPVLTAAISPEGKAYAESKPAPLQPYYAALHADGEHNAVLNFEKLGLAAMELGDFRTAEWAFDQALSRIEAIYGRDPAAAAARSKWAAEAFKAFKGEPFERSMAYYYRGLLYLRAGDYENARASFAMAEYQDTVSEAEEYQGDFALMTYLMGWSARCAGNDGAAQEAFAAAAAINPELKPPASGENLLVLAELGDGPVKMRRGGSEQLLSFAFPTDAGENEAVKVSLGPGGPVLEPRLADSVIYQALTRGSRPVDVVLQGKANFQTNNQLAGGLLYYAAASAPVLLIPMLAFASIAEATKTTADIRMWDSLPNRVMLATAKADRSAEVSFSYSGAAEVAKAAPWMQAHAGACGIAWSRSRSALAKGAGTPGNEAATVKRRAAKAEFQAQDKAFRLGLAADPAAAGGP